MNLLANPYSKKHLIRTANDKKIIQKLPDPILLQNLFLIRDNLRCQSYKRTLVQLKWIN
jgi:hypothetical protein